MIWPAKSGWVPDWSVCKTVSASIASVDADATAVTVLACETVGSSAAAGGTSWGGAESAVGSAGVGSSVQSQFQSQTQAHAQESVSVFAQLHDQSAGRVHAHDQVRVPATGADPVGSSLTETVPCEAALPPSPFQSQSHEVTSAGIWASLPSQVHVQRQTVIVPPAPPNGFGSALPLRSIRTFVCSPVVSTAERTDANAVPLALSGGVVVAVVVWVTPASAPGLATRMVTFVFWAPFWITSAFVP